MDELSLEYSPFEDELDDAVDFYEIVPCADQLIDSVIGSTFHLLVAALASKFVREVVKGPKTLQVLFNLAITTFILSRQYSKVANFGHILALFLTLLLSSYSLLRFNSQKFAPYVAVISTLLILQGCIGTENFLSIRGSLMIFGMRFITAHHLLGQKKRCLDILTYLTDPVTLVFGPYLTFDEYFSKRTEGSFSRVLRHLRLLLLSFGCLVLSTCFADVVPIYSDFFDDWLTAFSFRFSHYFVGFLSQALLVLVSIDVAVVDVTSVEFPRSVVDIVAAWDVPMHKFLHTYVFKESRNRLGPRDAILFTFFVSATLHGYDTQIALVLLTLGYISYVESEVRRQLAAKLSACVECRPCTGCSHDYKKNHILTLTVNFVFRILAFLHLLYTGMIFTNDHGPTGYPLVHTFEKWRQYSFASHLITVTMHFCIYPLER